MNFNIDISNTIVSTQNGINYDCDSSPAAWEYFKSVYDSDNWKLLNEFDLDNTKTYNELYGTKYKENKYKRLLSPIKSNSEYAKEGILWKRFTIGGDTDFNFNGMKCRMFENLLSDDREAISMLATCRENHHKLFNFSLMPATGSLNNYKGKNRYDRFDVLIKDLNDFFNSISCNVLCEAGQNTQPLKNFLNTFDDIYDYCKKIYFLHDKAYIDNLIENGRATIETNSDVINYMNLALKFWDLKKEYLKTL